MTNMQPGNANTPDKPKGNVVLLTVALILGFLTASMTFFVFYKKEQGRQGDFINVYRLRVDKNRDTYIKKSDVQTVRVPRDYLKSMNTLIHDHDGDGFINNKQERLRQNVQRGMWLDRNHYTESDFEMTAIVLKPGEREVQLPASRDNPPMNILPGDFVSVMGVFFVKKTGRMNIVTVIEEVQVVAVDGIKNRKNIDRRHKARIISVRVKKAIHEKLLEIQQSTRDKSFIFNITASTDTPRAGEISSDIEPILKDIREQNQRIRRSTSSSPGSSGPSGGGVIEADDSPDSLF